MEQPIVSFILGRLSALSDDELANLDFDSVSTVVNNGDLSDSEKQQLKRIFTSIQKELGMNHHGVKGMKWGVRRFQNKDGTLTKAGERRLAEANAKSSIFGTAQAYSIKTRSGETISVEPIKPPSIGTKLWRALTGYGPDLGERGDANYTLNDSSGNKIGELSLISKSSKVAYIDWITVDESQRGKGYATDVINDAISKARASGYSKVELNALKKPRPLYERLGFTYQDRSKVNIITRISEFELGTKRMEYDLGAEITHGASESFVRNLKMESTIYTVAGREFELQHHGVKGMKWGVRKAQQLHATLDRAKANYKNAQREYAKLDRAKANYRNAELEYHQAINKAYNRSIAAISPVRKHRLNNAKRWADATEKANAMNKAKAAYEDQKKVVRTNTTTGQKMIRGAQKTAKALTMVGTMYVVDQVSYGGAGTKAVKGALTAVGMAGITAYTAARGGTDIHWYDKQGRRII